MAVTLEDLQPKPFKVNIKGVELDCKPPRLSQTLILAKIGDILENIKNSDSKDIKQAEVDLDQVIADLIPELKDTQLDMSATLQFIEQVMQQVQPSENAELNQKGVKLDSDPKAGATG